MHRGRQRVVVPVPLDRAEGLQRVKRQLDGLPVELALFGKLLGCSLAAAERSQQPGVPGGLDHVGGRVVLHQLEIGVERVELGHGGDSVGVWNGRVLPLLYKSRGPELY